MTAVRTILLDYSRFSCTALGVPSKLFVKFLRFIHMFSLQQINAAKIFHKGKAFKRREGDA